MISIKIMKSGYMLIFLLLLFGCDKFEGDQTVPSYISIESIGFDSYNEIQGTSNQKISDVWVYVDDDLIGGFELPATIPVLVEGIHKLELRAGIILNGISDTRAPNPCWKSIIFNQFNFTPDSITQVSGSTTYLDNAEFVWMENFEDASLAIKKSINSDTGIVRTQPANAPEAFVDEFSSFSGISYLDNDRPYVQLVSDDGNGEGFAFDRGDFIFLELNYKNNIPLVVGVYIKLSDNTIEERPFVAISPTDEWNKIYINFTPIVNETVDGQTYMIYIEADILDDYDNAVILLDNIKLVTRPNL
jgi:hypothetical protein